MLWFLVGVLALWLLRQSRDLAELRAELAMVRAAVTGEHWPPLRPVVRPDAAEGADDDDRWAPEPKPESEGATESADLDVVSRGRPDFASPWGSAPPESSRIDVAEAAPVADTSSQPESRQGLGELLAERGLAWLGGAGLALGGALLVGYVAQQGWLGPLVRLALAVLLGSGLIGVGEWIRRRGTAPLVANLASGAGAAILYATVWAAHGLYGYVPLAPTAVLLGAVSALLFGLSLRLGQPLGLLAVAGAFAAPAVTGLAAWAELGLLVYLLAALAAGTAAATRRAWRAALVATVIGALAWSVVALVQQDSVNAGLLAVAAAIAPLLAAEFWADPARTRWRKRAGEVGGIALFGAAMILAVGAGMQFAPAYGAANLALLLASAVALRRGLVVQDVFAALVLPMAAGLATGVATSDGVQAGAWALATAGLLAPLGLFSSHGRVERAIVAAAAAISTAALTALVAAVEGGWTWLWPLSASVVLLGAAALAARGRGETPDVRWWAAGGTAATLAAVVTGSGPVPAPVWMSVAAFAFAALGRRSGWRTFDWALVVAAALALGAALNPAFLEAGWSDRPATALGSACAAAAMLLAASRMLGRSRTAADSAQTAAIGLLLIAAFIGVNWFATRGSGQPLDALITCALYGLLLLGGGLLGLMSERADASLIVRVRSRVLLGAGGLFTLAVGLLFSPWWGATERVVGAPVADSLLLAYLAPGLLLGFAGWRFYAREEAFAGRAAAMAGAGLTWLWALHAVRRAFDGPAFRQESMGVLEAAVYVLIALLVPLGLFVLSRRSPARAEPDLRRAAAVTGWASTAFAVVVLELSWSPWWSCWPGALGVAAWALVPGYAVAVALSPTVGRTVGGPGLWGWSRAAAVLHGLMGLSLVLRLAFGNGEAVGFGDVSRLETWTYSAAWAVFGVAVLAWGARRGDAILRWSALAVLGLTVAKVLLVDLAALDGVVRAASFLAVGALLMLGAYLARGWSTRRTEG